MAPPLYTAKSPGDYLIEIDASQQTNGAATTIGAIAAASRRGPLGPQLYTSADNFLAANGPVDITWGYGHVSALPFLVESSQLWFNRIVDPSASYAFLQIENDVAGPDGNATRLFSGSSGWPTAVGSGPEVSHAVFSAALVSGDNVSLTISDSTLTATATAVFATSNDATLTALAASITTQIQATWGAGSAVIAVVGSALAILPDAVGSNARSIRVVPPLLDSLTSSSGFADVIFTEIGATITNGGTASATYVTQESTSLLDIWAENPGGWANDYGISMPTVAFGVQQRIQLTFSAALVTTNSFLAQLTVKGKKLSIGPITFSGNNDATLASIATEITLALGGQGSAFVSHINGSVTNDRQITIVSPVDGPNTLAVLSAQVVNGSSQATVTWASVVSGIAGVDTFQLNVYSRSNVNTPIETFTVSFNQQLDGYNTQQFVEEVINLGANKSLNIRVAYVGAHINPSGRIMAANPTIVWLAGGADGNFPSNGTATDAGGSDTVCAGWNTFLDAETYTIDLLINAGYTAPAVQQTMDTVATTRKDCFAILDMPSASQGVTDAITYCATLLNVTSTYSSIYSPDLQIVDSTSDQLIYVPPSGYIAARFAATDQNQGVWFAAAGLTRGVIQNVQGLRYYYNQGDRDTLDPAQINCLRRRRGAYVIWGVNTRYPISSLLQFNSVRRMYLFIETSILNSLEANNFDPINPQTEFLIRQKINTFLQPMKDAEAITNFLVLCDNVTNNGPANIDAGQLNVSVYIVPVTPAKVIVLRSIITPNSISFQELIANSIF